MGKTKKKYSLKERTNKEKKAKALKARKIGASTPNELTNDRITAFGGGLSLVKFFDAVEFEKIFQKIFCPPKRKPNEGSYKMIYSLLLLLFIGFTRIGHFTYLRTDFMLCGIMGVIKLKAVSTYWRFLDSMGLNQSYSILRIIAELRERSWQLCGFKIREIHIDVDTTVETVYGEIEGARKCHNRKNRGKKGLRPILAFVEETREYLCGKLRKGETVSGKQFGKFIEDMAKYIPSCVKKVTLRADGEFISEESCTAAEKRGYTYIFGNKSCKPLFKKDQWYSRKKGTLIQYNSCDYKPLKWSKKRRFVAMRIPKEKDIETDYSQIELFKDDNYKYRIFVTNQKGIAHKIIDRYDKRADCENLVGEAKREGLAAIPSKKFKNNHVFFQIVMLSFNIWRYLKFLAAQANMKKKELKTCSEKKIPSKYKIIPHPIINHTARIARLKLLFIGAKITCHDNRAKVQYSLHDERVSEFRSFLNCLDHLRKKKKPWDYHDPWNPLSDAA